MQDGRHDATSKRVGGGPGGGGGGGGAGGGGGGGGGLVRAWVGMQADELTCQVSQESS